MPKHDEQPGKLRLYSQLGFGTLVVFGVVGGLAGYRQASAFVMLMTAVGWALTRILVEAIEAWRVLHPPSRDSTPPPPPNPPGAAA